MAARPAGPVLPTEADVAAQAEVMPAIRLARWSIS